MRIWLASGNDHKKQEVGVIFAGARPDLAVQVAVPPEAGIPFDPVEDGATFLENALIKARALRRLLEGRGISDPVLADDSGLCVDALSGRPGIHSARYGSAPDGKQLSSPERNGLLLAELGDAPNRRARFVCAMVLVFPGDRLFAVQETLEGEILREGRGEGGFGYDPLLYLPGMGRTVAELTLPEKNALSHRGKAGRALAGLLGAADHA